MLTRLPTVAWNFRSGQGVQWTMDYGFLVHHGAMFRVQDGDGTCTEDFSIPETRRYQSGLFEQAINTSIRT